MEDDVDYATLELHARNDNDDDDALPAATLKIYSRLGTGLQYTL